MNAVNVGDCRDRLDQRLVLALGDRLPWSGKHATCIALQVHVHVPGSLLEKLRLNIVTEMLITVYERGCGRLFWLSINGDAIRVKNRLPTPGLRRSQ
jgi:hypothetical protein